VGDGPDLGAPNTSLSRIDESYDDSATESFLASVDRQLNESLDTSQLSAPSGKERGHSRYPDRVEEDGDDHL